MTVEVEGSVDGFSVSSIVIMFHFLGGDTV